MRADRARFRLTAAGVLLGIAFLATTPCEGARMRVAYLRLDASDHEEFTTAIELAENRGAVLRHRISPYAAIGEVLEGTEALLESLPGVHDVIVGEVLKEQMAGFELHEVYAAKAYNRLRFPTGNPAAGEGIGERDMPPITHSTRIDPDPLRIPKRYIDEMKAAAAARGAPSGVPPATSEFMLGHVAMAVIMPESDPGRGSHDWLESEEEIATEEIIAALDWWVRHAPEENLRITYEINYRVPVALEPISKGGWAIEDKWAGQTLANLGYDGVNHFAQSYVYIEEMRRRYKADWGFISFILHGFKGQDFGGFLAYAYLGGPLNANIYSNGSLGPERLDRVMAHEIGHNFYTLDEYEASPHDCSARSGYLNAENANKRYGGSACVLDQPCIMRGGGQETELAQLHPCRYTEGQVGWWDSDGDGTPDVLDTNPIVEALSIDAAPDPEAAPGDPLHSPSVSFRGRAVVVPLENLNPMSETGAPDITIEPIAVAQYRVDGGPWRRCDPLDGSYDCSGEEISFVITGLSPWESHTVEARAVTAHGNVTPDSLLASMEFFVSPDPGRAAAVRHAGSNPTRPPVAIRFAPVHPSGNVGLIVPVVVSVYDALGRKLKTVEVGDFETGRYYVTEWDGSGDDGKTVPAGVYLIGMNSHGILSADKVLVIP